MRFTITPLGGAGRPLSKVVAAIVQYLEPRREPDLPAGAQPTTPERGPSRYYADGGEEPGRWRGRGAEAMHLCGEVLMDDFTKVLAGRDPHTGARLITAQGSAGRRPRLGVGTAARLDAEGRPLYGPRDAAAVLHLPVKQVIRMVATGEEIAMSRFLRVAGTTPPGGSYLVPTVDGEGNRWVDDAELERCEEALAAGVSREQVAALGRLDEKLLLAEAARLIGVTHRYLRRLAQRYEDHRSEIDAALAEGRRPRSQHLVAERGGDGRWLVTREELAAFVGRRRQPAIRVGYDLTLTTEKSLSILALLGGPDVCRTVLGAIEAGNDWAIDWLEDHAAAARDRGQVVPVKGWTVASFRHLTSRALDPFAHHHNVIANTVEDHHDVRRALDARALYREAMAASALATAEMRYQLTRKLGVRWRPASNGGWEIAGIPHRVVRAFSRRRSEIEDALRELEEAIGRGTTLDEVDQVVVSTRPAKQQAEVRELVDRWWQRAAALGFDRDDLAACVGTLVEPSEPDSDEVFAALAAPDGICANLSIFNRGDLLQALVNLPVATDTGDSNRGDDAARRSRQPLIVSAEQLEQLADRFLVSHHVVQLVPGSDDTPARYTTRAMLDVQDRVVARYRAGLDADAGRVPDAIVEATLAQHRGLTDEQRALVRAFCTSGDSIQCAIGYPGAGKTTSMLAARDAWRAAGWKVAGAAVKGEAAQTLGATAGIPTETLAWYLAHQDPATAPIDSRTVLIVDEASTVSDRDLDRLRWLAEATGATLRLVGDPAQHDAVEAGGMFRVICERHQDHTPTLTQTHRLRNPADLAAANTLRDGDIGATMAALEAAGHLHVVDDELQGYVQVLARWWQEHRAGQHHPMVDRRNSVRRSLNRLAHMLLRAVGEVGHDELVAADGRRYSVGDRVVARAPNRDLHPPGRRDAYVRNGAVGTVVALHHDDAGNKDGLIIDFDAVGVIEIPQSFIDGHAAIDGHAGLGLDHAYALTSYAVTGSTYPISTSRIDPGASRAETYVNITRGQHANHLYVVAPPDPLDGERLPRTPPDPLDEAVTRRLANSTGERTAWEIREDQRQRAAEANRGRSIER